MPSSAHHHHKQYQADQSFSIVPYITLVSGDDGTVTATVTAAQVQMWIVVAQLASAAALLPYTSSASR